MDRGDSDSSTVGLAGSQLFVSKSRTGPNTPVTVHSNDRLPATVADEVHGTL